jgi:hypothetical protein
MSSFVSKVKAILSGEEPPKKGSKATSLPKLSLSNLLDEGAGESDKALAQKALPVVEAMRSYAASPLYLKRLQGMKVDRAEAIQQERVGALSRVRFGHMTSGNNNSERNYGWGGENDRAKGGYIAMSKESPLSKIAHEVGHNTNRSISLPVAEGARPTTATGVSLAPVESWKLINSANMAPEIKTKAYQGYVDSAQGPYGVMVADPTASVPGYDEHGKDAAELKSDLDGLRYLLYQKGITNSYGEALDEEKWKRATEHPEVQKDEIFQRMLRQYRPAAIIKNNNEIAKAGGEKSSLA